MFMVRDGLPERNYDDEESYMAKIAMEICYDCDAVNDNYWFQDDWYRDNLNLSFWIFDLFQVVCRWARVEGDLFHDDEDDDDDGDDDDHLIMIMMKMEANCADDQIMWEGWEWWWLGLWNKLTNQRNAPVPF